MNKDFIMSYSGGKDSIFALYKMIKNGYNPIGLFTIMKYNNGGSMGHELNKQMLSSVSDSLGIPIHFLDLQCDISYATQTEEFLKKFKNKGIEICAYGDVSFENSKNSSESLCNRIGMSPIYPLWQLNEEEYVQGFIQSGFKCLVKSVLPKLPKELVGREFDESLVAELKKHDVSICGEYGEYHTFVYDGPIFKHPVSYQLGEKVSIPPYDTIEISVK
ncbi:diphthine--ammonia ligase [Oscillospiraceae bacterium PP1C4]